MKKFLTTIAALAFSFVSVAQDRTILEIDDEKIYAEEFIHIFNKNSKDAKPSSIDEVNDYMNLFVNFKLKVHEGMAQGLDTTQSFKTEIAGYKKQLSHPYLTDKSIDEQLERESYERMQYDIDASHILVKVEYGASAEDTLKAWKKINDIYKKLQKGADFEKLVMQYSDDKSKETNKGHLGFRTVFGYVYDFETVMYNTEVGQISKPFKTKYGYHILKVEAKRPARGRYKVAHIMVVSPKDADEETKLKAKNRVEEVYAKLQAGADFAEMADKYSDDRQTAKNGGVIEPLIEVGGRMIREFEDATFALENVGDFSPIVPTKYGYHIIKLVRKDPIKSFEECKADIKSKLSSNARSDKSRASVIQRLTKEYNITVNQKNVDALVSEVTDSIFAGKWEMDTVKPYNKVVLTIKDKEYTQKDFLNYLKKYNREQPKSDKLALIQRVFNNYRESTIVGYEESILEEKYPSFKYLLREYHDGILLFNLTNEEVWTKAVNDTVGLKKFYEANKNNYMWDYRYDIKAFNCKDEKIASKFMSVVQKTHNEIASIEKLNKKDSTNVVAGETALNELNQSLFVDRIVADNNIPREAGFEKVIKNNENVVTIIRVVEPEAKEFNEIKGVITAAYQDYLEKEWIKQLKNKYKLTVHDDVVKQVYEELSK